MFKIKRMAYPEFPFLNRLTWLFVFSKASVFLGSAGGCGAGVVVAGLAAGLLRLAGVCITGGGSGVLMVIHPLDFSSTNLSSV